MLKTKTLINTAASLSGFAARDPALARPPSQELRPAHGAILWSLRAGAGRRAVAPGRARRPAFGDIAHAAMERRENTVKPLCPWDISVGELQLWGQFPPQYWYFGVSLRAPAPSKGTGKCFPSGSHLSNTGLPYTRF